MNGRDPILILGLGNELLCDDAIGVKLALEFEYLYKSPDIHFRTSCNGGLDIVETLSGYKHVIIIDAIKTQDGIPGNIYHFTPDDFKDTLHVSSFHDISFLTALKFASFIDIEIPEDIHMLAIEIAEDMLFSDQFSEPIQKKYGTIRNQINKHLDQLLSGYNEKDIVNKGNSAGLNT